MGLKVSVTDDTGTTHPDAHVELVSLGIDYIGVTKMASLCAHHDLAAMQAGNSTILIGAVPVPVAESADMRADVYAWLKTQNAVVLDGVTIDFTTAVDE